MGRAKIGIALAGVIVMLLGVATFVAMRGDGGSNNANSVVRSTSDTAPAGAAPAVLPEVTSTPTTAPAPAAKANGTTATTKAPAKAPASTTPTTTVPQRSVQEIQQIIAGITAQLQTQIVGSDGAPLTKEQVEAQLRAQLKQLGITY